jgi:hypothetical protein
MNGGWFCYVFHFLCFQYMTLFCKCNIEYCIFFIMCSRSKPSHTLASTHGWRLFCHPLGAFWQKLNKLASYHQAQIARKSPCKFVMLNPSRVTISRNLRKLDRVGIDDQNKIMTAHLNSNCTSCAIQGTMRIKRDFWVRKKMLHGNNIKTKFLVTSKRQRVGLFFWVEIV